MKVSQKHKYELIEKLVLTEDELLLNQVRAILEGSEIQLWEDLNPKLKASIKRGVAQSKKGKGTPHEVVMKEYPARLQK